MTTPPRRPAVFLDRDGTLVDEVPYLSDPAQVRLLPGVAAALRSLAAAGYALVVVTNQAGVAHGLHGEQDIASVHEQMAGLLAAQGVRIDGWYYCPHHPEGIVDPYVRSCDCRKPGPGMLLAAADDLHLDLARSWLIGNALSDAGAALAAGARPLLVRTGYGENLAGTEIAPTYPDVPAAAQAILAAA